MMYHGYQVSLNDFASRNELNKIIAENMIDISLLQEGEDSFEEKAYFCFHKAYQICKDITDKGHVEIWEIPGCLQKARYGSKDKDVETIIQAVTLSLVVIFVEHMPKFWKDPNKEFLEKLKDKIQHMYLTGETITLPGGAEILSPMGPMPACARAYKVLRRGTNIDFVIPNVEFMYNSQLFTGNDVIQSAVEASVKAVQNSMPKLIRHEKENGLVFVSPNIESVNKEEPDKEELHAEIAKLKVEVENLKAQLEEASDKSFQSKEITNTEKDKIINELQQRIADYEAIFDPQDIKRKKVIAMTGKQHVILFLAVLAYHNKIPNARTNLSFLLSFISSRNESTMIDYLKNRITQEECDTLAQYFNQETPFIASLIRELPKKLEKDKSEKNRAKALNNTNK